jgi:predicted DNA-binding transcriptional regulator AlpA
MTARTAITLLNNAETAEQLGIKPNTLEIWRTKGTGPAYRKIGRSVRYVESDVLAWLDAQTHTNTSQYPTHLNQGHHGHQCATA